MRDRVKGVGCVRRARLVVVVYDVKQASESQLKPLTRIPPLKDVRYRKAIQATLDARREAAGYDEPCIIPGDVYMLFDGKRRGNIPKLRSGFKSDETGDELPRKTKEIHITYAEEALTGSLNRVTKGTASVKQNEGLIMTSRDKSRLQAKKRKHFAGTTRGHYT